MLQGTWLNPNITCLIHVWNDEAFLAIENSMAGYPHGDGVPPPANPYGSSPHLSPTAMARRQRWTPGTGSYQKRASTWAATHANHLSCASGVQEPVCSTGAVSIPAGDRFEHCGMLPGGGPGRERLHQWQGATEGTWLCVNTYKSSVQIPCWQFYQ